MQQDLQPLVFEFVEAFARFEYALQRTGSRNGKIGDTPTTCWEKAREKLAEYKWTGAAQALLNAKPTRQTIAADGFNFVPVPSAGKNDVGLALALVKAVRNNLFHGGKMDKSGWDDPKRLFELLPPATQIVRDMADADIDVRAYFRNEF